MTDSIWRKGPEGWQRQPETQEPVPKLTDYAYTRDEIRAAARARPVMLVPEEVPMTPVLVWFGCTECTASLSVPVPPVGLRTEAVCEKCGTLHSVGQNPGGGFVIHATRRARS